MTTMLLVHGAWGGSYGFRTVKRLLHERGHEVITPSLTGIGERRHLAGPHVNLDLHIEDVLNVAFHDDLHDMLVLGFSYGGMVVTGALDQLGDRVRSLVYLDALVPADGQAATDLVPLPIPTDTWEVPPLPRELATPEATAWSNERRVPMSVGTLTTPVSLATPLEERGLPLAFIKATADPNEPPDSPFWHAARHAEGSPAWTYHEVATNHMVPSMEPEALADILDSLA